MTDSKSTCIQRNWMVPLSEKTAFLYLPTASGSVM